jgi:hypothetical protein
MEHSYIEEHNIADRYLLDKLSAQERMRFEEHFKSCVQCLDRLEIIDGLRLGLRTVAAKEVWRSRAYVEGGLLAWIMRLSRASQKALLAGVILLITSLAGLVILEWSSARRDLAQKTQAAAEWRRKYEENVQAASDLMKEMQTRDWLASQPESEREDRSRLPKKIEKVMPSQTVVPVFALSVMRNAGSDLTQPINLIKPSPNSKLIVLLLELGPDLDLQSYRGAISTVDGRNIWRESNLKPGTDNTLALSFNSSLFKSGNYLLTLEGVTTQKRYVLTAKYTFSVLTK